jgi:hypothetical protein
MIQETGNASRIASVLADGARRLANDRGQELAKVIGRELLSLVRGRLGDNVGDALGAYISELKTALDEQLSSRITAAIDPGVVGLIIALAEEVCALAEGRPVLLALDSAERLQHEDAAILADLAETLPAGLRLRVALSTYDANQRKKANYLNAETTAVTMIEVPPIETGAIQEWLADAGIPSDDAGEVEKLTGGYGLHVGDLIDHLRRGGEMEQAPLNEQFAKRTREAWAALDPETAANARSISVFTDPLPADRLESFLSLDPFQRGEFEDRLAAARVFSVEVNGQRWFHEQRRRFIVDEILDAKQRAAASERAAFELWEMYGDGAEPPRLAELARLVAAAPGMSASDPGVATILGLDRDQLAVAATALELIDSKAQHPAVSGDDLLTYAMTVFRADGDLVAALEALRDDGLLIVVEKEGRTAVVPYGWSPMMGAVLSGRAEAELGRRPIPEVGSTALYLEILPRLGRFRKTFYGFGRPSFQGLGQEAIQLSNPADGLILVGGGHDPALLLRISHAGRPMNAVATFGSKGPRDEALQRLQGLRTTVLGEDLVVTDSLAFPSPLVPARRFVSALERVVPGNLGSTPRLMLDQPLDRTVELERRALTLKIIRALCSPSEAKAMRVEIPTGLAWYSPGNGIVEVEVKGGREGFERIDATPELGWEHPFSLFRIARHLHLSVDEWIGSQHFRSSTQPTRKDPVVETVALLTKHAIEFNKVQGTYKTVPITDRDALSRMLFDAHKRQFDDAKALFDLPIGVDLLKPQPENLYVAVLPGARQTPMGSIVVWATMPTEEGQERVDVELIDDTGLSRQPVELMQETFSLDLTKAPRAGWGGPDTILSELLGYGVEETRLI